MTGKQERFIKEYLVDLNAAAAARRAGYSARTAHVAGSRLLRDVRIKAAVEQALGKQAERTEIKADWVIQSLKQIADRCMQAVPVYRKEGKELVETGEWEFDSSGANRSLELLGKHLGMFTEKLSLFGAAGKAISISINGIKK